MIDTGLQGKVALVTGANHGIGTATAKALAAEGVAVLIHFLRITTPQEAGDPADEAAGEVPSPAYYHRQRRRLCRLLVREEVGQKPLRSIWLTLPQFPSCLSRQKLCSGQ